MVYNYSGHHTYGFVAGRHFNLKAGTAVDVIYS